MCNIVFWIVFYETLYKIMHLNKLQHDTFYLLKKTPNYNLIFLARKMNFIILSYTVKFN